MWILKENVMGRVITELEINLFLSSISLEIEIKICHSISIPVRTWNRFPLSGCGGWEFIYLDKPMHKLLPRINLQYPIGARPVLNGSTEFILRFLRTTRWERDEATSKRSCWYFPYFETKHVVETGVGRCDCQKEDERSREWTRKNLLGMSCIDI